MFRKIVIATVATVSFAACGGTKTVYVETTDAINANEGYEVVTTTEAPIATPAPTLPPVQWTAEDEFLFDIESTVGYTGVSDYDLLDTGYLVCQTLRSGASAQDLLIAITSVGYSQDFLISLSASAVLNLCPDQQWKIDAL